MMSTAGKRCYYEVLGLTQDCSADEIRSAYKKLALQRHPDKLIQSGLSSDDATASFQELVHAYEVLSDPKERKWYDSHRSQILFSDLSSPSNSSDSIGIPNLFSYFSTSCYTDYSDSKKGFYRVYGEVFDKVFKNEVNYARKLGLGLGGLKEAPLMGDLKSPYSQVNAFYGYWLGFCTVMDFGWVDKWDCDAGGNRKTRRLMEEDNKKIRKKAKREFNETVRGLAEFVKKRDKRVIDMMVRKETEREKKREEELARKKEMERQRMEKARTYEEPEWTKVEEVEYDGEDAEREEEEELKEWYCVVCSKKFKSEKQWKNHEQSKKHKEKVAELKASFDDEDDVGEIESEEAKAEEDVDDNISNGRFNSCFQSEVGEIESEEAKAEEDVDDNVSNGRFNSCFQSEVGGVSELETEFRDGMRIEVEETGDKLVTEPEGERSDVDDVNPSEELKFDKSDDDGSSILEAMLSGRKNKKLGRWGPQSNLDSNNDEELEFTEYNKVKVKKGRRAKGGKTKHVDGEALRASNGNSNSLNMEATAKDDSQIVNDLVNVESNVDGRDNIKSKADKKNTEAEMKKASKGRKQKAKTKHLTLECEKCGVGFDSRNKLHKHLNETDYIGPLISSGLENTVHFTAMRKAIRKTEICLGDRRLT